MGYKEDFLAFFPNKEGFDEAKFNTFWKEFNTNSRNAITKDILEKYEKKLGVSSMSELEVQINDLREKTKDVANFPELKAGLMRQVKELEDQKVQLQKALDSEKNNSSSNSEQYNKLLGMFEKLRDERNVSKLEQKLKGVAKDLGIHPDMQDAFSKYVQTVGLAKMGYDEENEDYYPTTNEFEYKENDIPMKGVFSRDKFDEGIKKIYQKDDLLQKMFKVVEKKPNGNGYYNDNKGSSTSNLEELGNQMKDMSRQEAREFYLNKTQEMNSNK